MDENNLNFESQSLPHPDSGMMPDDEEMMVAHVKPSEIVSCNEIQGGESIDPELGIPEFRRLGKILKNPEIRGLFIIHMKTEMQKGHEDPELKYIEHALPHPDSPESHMKFHKPPADDLPEAQMIEHDGVKGDTTLGYFPVSVLDVFDEVIGKPSTNKDGLPQYGNFFSDMARGFSRALGSFGREALRTIAPIAGAIFGGPVGAGLGSAAAGFVTGSKPSDALMRGLKIGAATGTVGSLGNYISPQFMANNPNLASALGQGAGGMFGGFGEAGGPLAGLNNWMSGTSSASQIPSTGNNSKDILLGAGKKEAIGSSGSSLMEMAKSPLALLMASGALMMHGHGKDQKALKKAKEEEKREMEEQRRRSGWDTPLNSITMELPELRMRTVPIDAHKLKHGIEENHFYKKGGPVKEHIYQSINPHASVHIQGPGKGQDDVIDTDDVHEGDFIIDATTTAHTGDGSSKAGAKEWLDFMNRQTEKYLKEGGMLDNSPRPRVPASLSNDEVKIHYPQVTAFGGGDNKRGSNILTGMQKIIRKEKSEAGPNLPPPAKPLEYYMKKSIRLNRIK